MDGELRFENELAFGKSILKLDSISSDHLDDCIIVSNVNVTYQTRFSVVKTAVEVAFPIACNSMQLKSLRFILQRKM